MEKILISDLKDNTNVKSVFSVKYKHSIKEYTNGYMFKIGIADNSGETEVTYFGGRDKSRVESVFNGFQANDVVYIDGQAKLFKNKINININAETGNIRKAATGEYELSMFVYNSNQDLNKLMDYIDSHIQMIQNPFLKSLMNSFFEDKDFAEKFKNAPAAMYKHHACIGGLLEHTWGILKICEAQAEIHESLDKDLLIAGAILHDIGKIHEFEVTSNIKQTEPGMLLGHVGIAIQMINDKIREIPNFPEILKNKILHMVISHHGEKEYGTMVEPALPEAAVVYLADFMDSQTTQYIRLKKDAQGRTEDFRTYKKDFGSVYLK